MPEILACVRKAGEFRWHVILGSAICGGSECCVWFVVCRWYNRIVGCVLHWWMLARSRRALIVRVGVGRLLNLVCMDELFTRF